jgi:hypothetical protein
MLNQTLIIVIAVGGVLILILFALWVYCMQQLKETEMKPISSYSKSNQIKSLSTSSSHSDRIIWQDNPDLDTTIAAQLKETDKKAMRPVSEKKTVQSLLQLVTIFSQNTNKASSNAVNGSSQSSTNTQTSAGVDTKSTMGSEYIDDATEVKYFYI